MNGASAAVAGDLVLKRIEESGLNVMQTQRQLFYDGWLLRLSPGVAKRGRSVNPHFASSLPLADKFAYCERVYARHGLPTLFRITPWSQPSHIEAALAERGYESFDETLVQAVKLDRPPEMPEYAADVVIDAPDAPGFVEAVGDLRGSTATQREAHRERLVNSPLGKRHAVVWVGNRVVCTAQAAVEGNCVGLFDVVTAESARRRGYATLACASLLSWAWQHGAEIAYLQVTAGNAPAIASYRRFGFATVYTYHYRGRPGQCA